MYPIKYTLVILILGLVFYFTQRDDKLSEVERNAISDSLEQIALDFIKGWEPPFEEKLSLKPFTQSQDFSVVIDANYIPDYETWKCGLHNSLQQEKNDKESFVHNLGDIKIVVLSPESAVLTARYDYEYTRKNGGNFTGTGAFTMTFRLEQETWKVVHYHGSHGIERPAERI